MRLIRLAILTLCGVSFTALAWAGGGSRVSVDVPDPASAALAPGAALMVRVFNCGEPMGAAVDVHADGYIDGQRKTIVLKLTKTSETGVYGLARQWPASGRWVLSFTPRGHAPATTIVTVESAGQRASSVRMADVKLVDTKAASQEVKACLKAISNS